MTQNDEFSEVAKEYFVLLKKYRDVEKINKEMLQFLEEIVKTYHKDDGIHLHTLMCMNVPALINKIKEKNE